VPSGPVNLVGLSYASHHGISAKVFEKFYFKYLLANFKVSEKTEQYTIWEKKQP
jgi:hypothetical protein